MVLADGRGLPLVVHVTSASPNEVTLIKPLLARLRLRKGLINDRAADSDVLRERLAGLAVELVGSHRVNRNKPPTQDG